MNKIKKNELAVVVGVGIVGQATAEALSIINFYDKQKERRNVALDQVRDFKYVFICLPTPTNNKGCDTSIVEKMIKKIGNGPKFIIRSTVIPGTAEKLMKRYRCEIVSNPEFLTEATAMEDARKPDIIVIGASSYSLRQKISRLFYSKRRFPKSEVFLTDNRTAETIKYAVNSFYATKVIFANYLYRICRRMKVDYQLVKNALYKRKWVGDNHLAVPFRGEFGVRGKCLPKDLRAFATYSHNPFFLQMVKFMEIVNTWKD